MRAAARLARRHTERHEHSSICDSRDGWPLAGQNSGSGTRAELRKDPRQAWNRSSLDENWASHELRSPLGKRPRRTGRLLVPVVEPELRLVHLSQQTKYQRIKWPHFFFAG